MEYVFSQWKSATICNMMSRDYQKLTCAQNYEQLFIRYTFWEKTCYFPCNHTTITVNMQIFINVTNDAFTGTNMNKIQSAVNSTLRYLIDLPIRQFLTWGKLHFWGDLLIRKGQSWKFFSKFINLDRFFDIFLKDFWRIFLTDCLTDFSDRFFDRFFWKIFWQIFDIFFWKIFDRFLWQIFVTDFSTDFWDRFFDSFESN